MCDINKKTKLKTVVVYKVCRYMHDDKYYAYFSGMEVCRGKVKDLPFYQRTEGHNNPFIIRYTFNNLNGELTYNRNYNKNLLGRTSGFKLLKTAKAFMMMVRSGYSSSSNCYILKLTLGGDIMQGTGEGIAKNPDIRNSTVYAGTEILSVEKVQVKNKNTWIK
jgi:hypothetical protein